MTDMELDKLEALASAATPGPWQDVKGDMSFNIISNKAKSNVIVSCDCSDISVSKAEETTQKNTEFIAATHPAAILEIIADLKKARADACEWISIARWLARELGKDSIPETEWIILARQALGFKNEWGDGESQNGFRIYSALEPGHLASNSCSVPPREATCTK